jgi:hypothetical protein
MSSTPQTPSTRLSAEYTSPEVSPPRALFAQEYDTLKELFNSCGFEATDGFLEHVQQQKQQESDGEEYHQQQQQQKQPRTRLQSITPNHSTSSFDDFAHVQQSSPNVPQFMDDATGAQKSSGGSRSFSPRTAKLLSNQQPYAELVKETQHFASESNKSVKRQWGQHVVRGSNVVDFFIFCLFRSTRPTTTSADFCFCVAHCYFFKILFVAFCLCNRYEDQGKTKRRWNASRPRPRCI